MIFEETPVTGAYVIDLEKIGDERGFFARVFCDEEFARRAKPRSMSEMEAEASFKLAVWFHQHDNKDLAAKYQLPLIPFFLEGVAGKPQLTLPDFIHPNAAGYTIVVDIVMKTLQPLLKK